MRASQEGASGMKGIQTNALSAEKWMFDFELLSPKESKKSQSVGKMKSKGWERGPSPVGSLGLISEGESERLRNDSGPPLVCGPGKTTES